MRDREMGQRIMAFDDGVAGVADVADGVDDDVGDDDELEEGDREVGQKNNGLCPPQESF